MSTRFARRFTESSRVLAGLALRYTKAVLGIAVVVGFVYLHVFHEIGGRYGRMDRTGEKSAGIYFEGR